MPFRNLVKSRTAGILIIDKGSAAQVNSRVMKRILLITIVCVLFTWSLAFAQTDKADVYQGSVNVGGLERTYVVHLPAGYGTGKEKPVPLVLVLHGGGGNASSAARISGFNAKSNQEGFIVVYPNGTGRFRKDVVLNWNAGNCCGYAMDNNVDDVAFLRALIEKVQRDHNVDRKRIFVTGLANGGMMAYRAACELSDTIAAVAPVAGALNVRECKPRFPVSVVIFHGTADGHVPYQGGEPKKLFERLRKRVDKPVSYAISLWVRSNGCSPVPRKEQRGSVLRENYTEGKDGTEVSVYTIKGEGHTWPGGKKGRYPGADEPTREISATNVMWEFFKNHPKP